MEATAIKKAKVAISTLSDEVAALKARIKTLDKSVAEATEQREEENEDYTQLMAQDTAAKELAERKRTRRNRWILGRSSRVTSLPDEVWTMLPRPFA